MTEDNKFTKIQIFDAPRDLMWKLWTEQKHLAEWFGPKGFPIISSKLDFTQGGSYLYGMDCHGSEMWGKWNFEEIAAPEKITFAMHFSDPSGGVTRHPFQPEWPLYMHTTFLFAEEKGKTRINIEWQPVNPTEAELSVFLDNLAGMNMGWQGTFEQLDAYLLKLQEK